MAYAWGQERLGEMLVKNDERNKDVAFDNVESVSNKTGFTKQTEQFDDYSVASADLSNYYVIRERQFAYNPSRINVGSIAYKEKGAEIGVVSPLYISFSTKEMLDDRFLWYWFKTYSFDYQRHTLSEGGVRDTLSFDKIAQMEIKLPGLKEQQEIGRVLHSVDSLLSLHQRSPPTANNNPEEATRMIANDKTFTPDSLFCDYFESWIKVYKEGAITRVTMQKYQLSLSWVKKIAPDLKLKEINRLQYQEILNEYAKYHERQTTMDFHHHIKAAILDAIDERLIDKDPTRKAIIKGKTPREKKLKYLSQFELHSLLGVLKLSDKPNWDWLILLIAKTGIRFSEALAVTPKDFDFSRQMLSISKTWNYKEDKGGFLPTKNKSSVRKIPIDWHTVIQFAVLVKDLPEDKPIFAGSRVFNATANDCLARRCKKAGIPVITMHGLRHTHASLLLFAGVSIASVAKRLGHSSMNTTERTYLHIIQELENKDIDLVMRALAGLV